VENNDRTQLIHRHLDASRQLEDEQALSCSEENRELLEGFAPESDVA